jgi:hypothetical protein
MLEGVMSVQTDPRLQGEAFRAERRAAIREIIFLRSLVPLSTGYALYAAYCTWAFFHAREGEGKEDLTLGLYSGTRRGTSLFFMWFLLGGVGLCALSVYACILSRSPEELERSPRILRLMALFTNRDFAYLVAALTAAGRLEWFLVRAALGTYLFAAALRIMSLNGNRAPAG